MSYENTYDQLLVAGKAKVVALFDIYKGQPNNFNAMLTPIVDTLLPIPDNKDKNLLRQFFEFALSANFFYSPTTIGAYGLSDLKIFERDHRENITAVNTIHTIVHGLRRRLQLELGNYWEELNMQATRERAKGVGGS